MLKLIWTACLVAIGLFSFGTKAAVTFDARFEDKNASQASPYSITSGSASLSGSVGANSNRVLIAFLGVAAPGNVSALAITWDGVAMTQIGTVQANAAAGEVWVFGLIAPATGSKVLSASWTGTAQSMTLGAVSLYNADQVTGWQNAGSDTGTGLVATSIATTANGDMAVVAHANNNATSTTITTGNSAYIETALNGNYALGYQPAVGATATVTWTLGSSVEWHNTKVDVIAASGGGGTVVNPISGKGGAAARPVVN